MAINSKDGHASALGSGGPHVIKGIKKDIKWIVNEHDKAANRAIQKDRVVQAGQRLKNDAHKIVSHNYEVLSKHHNENNKLNEKRQQRQSIERMMNAKNHPKDQQAGDGPIQANNSEDVPYDNPFEADYYNYNKQLEDETNRDYKEGAYRDTNIKKPHGHLWTKIKDLFVKHKDVDNDVGNNETPED